MESDEESEHVSDWSKLDSMKAFECKRIREHSCVTCMWLTVISFQGSRIQHRRHRICFAVHLIIRCKPNISTVPPNWWIIRQPNGTILLNSWSRKPRPRSVYWWRVWCSNYVRWLSRISRVRSICIDRFATNCIAWTWSMRRIKWANLTWCAVNISGRFISWRRLLAVNQKSHWIYNPFGHLVIRPACSGRDIIAILTNWILWRAEVSVASIALAINSTGLSMPLRKLPSNIAPSTVCYPILRKSRRSPVWIITTLCRTKPHGSSRCLMTHRWTDRALPGPSHWTKNVPQIETGSYARIFP